MKKLLLVTSLFCISLISNAQYFQHIYYSTPKNENEWINCGIRDTTIGDSTLSSSSLCYAATGYFKDKIGTGIPDVERVRYITTNKWGVPITNAYYKVYSSNQNSEYDAYGNFIEKTDDGYIMVGKVSSSTGDTIQITGQSDLYILRVNNAGTVVYTKRLDMGYAEEGMCIQKLNGSTDYIICGTRTKSNGSDAIVMRLTLAGAVVWCKAFNFKASVTNYYATANHLVIDANNKIYLTGSFKQNTTGNHNVLVFGVDQNGNLLTRAIIGDDSHDEIGNSIRRTNTAGKYIIVGEEHLTGQKKADGLVFNFQPSTATVTNYKYIHSWDVNPTTYASLIFEDVQERIHPTTSVQTYYATGVVSKAANGNNDAVVFKLSSTLNPQGEYHYGDPQNDFSKSIDLINYNQAGDGFIIFGGYGNASPAVTYSYIDKSYFNGVVRCNFISQDSLKTSVTPTVQNLDSIYFDNDTLINLYAAKYSNTDTTLCKDTTVTGGSSRIALIGNISQFKIWPNPIVQGNPLSIEFNALENVYVEVYVTDIWGKTLFSEKVLMEKGYNLIQTNEFDNLSAGAYLLHLKENGKETILKLIK